MSIRFNIKVACRELPPIGNQCVEKKYNLYEVTAFTMTAWDEDFIILIFMLCSCSITILLLTYCYCNISKPVASNPLNEIQMDNGRRLTSTNSDQQSRSVPFNIVLNGLEYEIMYNPSHEQSHQPCNAAQTARTNVSNPRTTNAPFCSGLNYVDHNTSNVTSSSISPLDNPPPPYDECVANSRPTPHIIINLPVT